MSVFTTPSEHFSLLDRKKQQWAKEREEMTNLNIPWGVHSRSNEFKSRSKMNLNDKFYCQRNPLTSLPPLNVDNLPPNRFHEFYDQGGETSGYASDAAPTTDFWPARRRSLGIWSTTSDGHNTPDSSILANERLRWGDRGLGVGHLWNPSEVQEGNEDDSPPGWVQRGLNNDGALVVVNHSSSEDTEHSVHSVSSVSKSMLSSYLRGQNVPFDDIEAQKRERKRREALEHQNAIKQQVAEREHQRKLERERRYREEQLEQERIKRECQREHERLLAEQKMNDDKIEKEKKKSEVMRRALEEAERQAKLEKLKMKYSRCQQIKEDEETDRGSDDDSHKPRTILRDEEVAIETKKTPLPLKTDDFNQSPSTPQHLMDNHKPIAPSINPNTVPITPQTLNQQCLNSLNLTTPAGAPLINIPGLSGIPSIDAVLNVQYALLMTNLSNSILNNPIAIPISSRLESAIVKGTTDEPAKSNLFDTENRILTPLRYKEKNMRDVATQTDNHNEDYLEKKSKDRYGSLDRNYRNDLEKVIKKHVKRYRSEDRDISAKDRPKWGVNQPSTEYLTQSEKDPAYLRRRLRKKLRELKLFDGRDRDSTDDEESRSSSLRDITSRPMMRRNRQTHTVLQNVNIYHTEIVPITSDENGRYTLCRKNAITKRQSISERFLIAKKKAENVQTASGEFRNTKTRADNNSRRHSKNSQRSRKQQPKSGDNSCEDIETIAVCEKVRSIEET